MNIQDMFATAHTDGIAGWDEINAFISQAMEEGTLTNSATGILEEDALSSGCSKLGVNANVNFHPESNLFNTPVVNTSREQNSLYQDCVLAISKRGTYDVPDAFKPENPEMKTVVKLDDKFLPNSALSFSPNLQSKSTPRSSTVTRMFHSLNSDISSTSGTPNKSTKKQFKCTEPNCGKIFERRYNLKVHTRRHTGETPYHCTKLDEGCTAQFRWRSSLRHHMKTIHNEVGGPIMKCTPAQHAELLTTVLPPSAGLQMLSASRPLAYGSALNPIKDGEDGNACLSPVTGTPRHSERELKVKTTTPDDICAQPALQYISRDAGDDVQFASPLSDLVAPCSVDDDEGGVGDTLFDEPLRSGDQKGECGWDNADIAKDWNSPVRSPCSNAVPVLDKEFF